MYIRVATAKKIGKKYNENNSKPKNWQKIRIHNVITM